MRTIENANNKNRGQQQPNWKAIQTEMSSKCEQRLKLQADNQPTAERETEEKKKPTEKKPRLIALVSIQYVLMGMKTIMASMDSWIHESFGKSMQKCILFFGLLLNRWRARAIFVWICNEHECTRARTGSQWTVRPNTKTATFVYRPLWSELHRIGCVAFKCFNYAIALKKHHFAHETMAIDGKNDT